jgi:hypothetical protein
MRGEYTEELQNCRMAELQKVKERTIEGQEGQEGLKVRRSEG